VVLLQAGQGGGLASLGGGGGTSDTVLGGRQAVTILTKATWWCGGIFLALSLALQFVPRGGTGSALQEKLRGSASSGPVGLPGTAPAEPTAPAAGGPAPAPQSPAGAQPAPTQQAAPQNPPAQAPTKPPPPPQPKQ